MTNEENKLLMDALKESNGIKEFSDYQRAWPDLSFANYWEVRQKVLPHYNNDVPVQFRIN